MPMGMDWLVVPPVGRPPPQLPLPLLVVLVGSISLTRLKGLAVTPAT